MDQQLATDQQHTADILRHIADEAITFLQGLSERPVGQHVPAQSPDALPDRGVGALGALEEFQHRYAATITGSAGPRYFGFVTGGATPAAIAGDWLVSIFDQNVMAASDSSAPQIERETIAMLRDLFHLSPAHSGAFVSGATMANVVGLALGRQWLAREAGLNLAEMGLYGLPPMALLSGSPHSSIYKALSILGMGKRSVTLVPTLAQREAVDVEALRALLEQQGPCIVVANLGTVNTGDFDQLNAIAELKQHFRFWLHVDAAFGGFAACSPRYRHLTEGLEEADSITIDAHKWLNVPYDSAMQFTRHQDLQLEVFQNSAAYLGAPGAILDYVHLTPENSRRFRALPAWFTLKAYGCSGYRELVERTCGLAQRLGDQIAQSDRFRLLAPVQLNIVCFTLAAQAEQITHEQISALLAHVRDTGRAFFTPTLYKGVPAIRAAFSNWRTTAHDLEIAWEALQQASATAGSSKA